MQTFLPYPDLAASAEVLDDRRLGKQRVEALQVLRALHLEDYGWVNHPAVTMWRGHGLALVAYGLAVVEAWVARGHSDTTAPLIAEFALPEPVPDPHRLDHALLPPWWGDAALHRSHRASLVRKDAAAYADLDVEDSTEPYFWPDPPAPPRAPRPFSAWLVRAASPDDRLAMVEQGVAVAPAVLSAADATPKQRRQRALFAEAVEPGDPLVCSDGAVLDLGEVTGPCAVTAEGVLSRPVRFRGRLRRADLCRPWQLQDPRWVSRLRGEPVLG